MGWHPDGGLIDAQLGRLQRGHVRQHPGAGIAGRIRRRASLWEQWTAPYPRFWRGDGPTRRIAFAPLFGHQYSQIFIDFRGIRDAVMREAGFDYFENSRRETYANRAYCTANPMGWDGYSDRVWGLTACDGPGNFRAAIQRRDAAVLRLCRARARWESRTGGTTARSPRRPRSARCHSRRRSWFPAPRRCCSDRAVRPLRLQGQLQPELHLH